MVGHGGPDDGLVLTDEVLQARSGSLAGHGHASRPPLTVGGRLGEFVTGAYVALDSATGRCGIVHVSAQSRRRPRRSRRSTLTFLTTPTLMARFPGGRLAGFRWVMIPGNEPTADGRYVGHHDGDRAAMEGTGAGDRPR